MTFDVHHCDGRDLSARRLAADGLEAWAQVLASGYEEYHTKRRQILDRM